MTTDDIPDQANLGRWLAQNVEGFNGPFDIIKFAGGQSNPTYRIGTTSGSYVLRRSPLARCYPQRMQSIVSIV